MVKIDISNRALFTLIAVVSIITLSGYVIAFGEGDPTTVGHQANDIDFTGGIIIPDNPGQSTQSYILTFKKPDTSNANVYYHSGNNVIRIGGTTGLQVTGDISTTSGYTICDGLGNCLDSVSSGQTLQRTTSSNTISGGLVNPSTTATCPGSGGWTAVGGGITYDIGPNNFRGISSQKGSGERWDCALDIGSQSSGSISLTCEVVCVRLV